MKFSIVMIKHCKCGKEFKTKPSNKQVVCNDCLIAQARKQLVNKKGGE